MSKPGPCWRGTAAWLGIGTQCSLASKRRSRRQKCRFSLLFLGLIKDADLTWWFFLLLKLQPPSLSFLQYSLAHKCVAVMSHICSPQVERKLLLPCPTVCVYEPLGFAWKAFSIPLLCLPTWSQRCCRCLQSKGLAGSLVQHGD